MWYERTRQNVYSSQNADCSVPRGFSDLIFGSELDLCQEWHLAHGRGPLKLEHVGTHSFINSSISSRGCGPVLLSPALLLCGLLDGCQLLDLYSAVSIILRRP